MAAAHGSEVVTESTIVHSEGITDDSETASDIHLKEKVKTIEWANKKWPTGPRGTDRWKRDNKGR